jgi:hypothetical protein
MNLINFLALGLFITTYNITTASEIAAESTGHLSTPSTIMPQQTLMIYKLIVNHQGFKLINPIKNQELHYCGQPITF